MPHIIKSVFNVSDFVSSTVEEIVSQIRVSYKDAITVIHKTVSKDDQKRLKVNLPLFTLGNFVDRIDNDGFVSTKYIMYDIDNIAYSDVDRIKKIVNQFSLFSFRSPSGKGIKFVIEMKEELNNSPMTGTINTTLTTSMRCLGDGTLTGAIIPSTASFRGILIARSIHPLLSLP